MSPAESHIVNSQTPRVSQGRIPQTFSSRHSSWSSTRPKLLTPREMLKMCFLCVLFVIGLASAVAALFFLVENLTRTKEVSPTVGTRTSSSVESTFQTSFNRVSTDATAPESSTATLPTKTSTVLTETLTTPTETITTSTKTLTVSTESPTVPSTQNLSSTVNYRGSTISSTSSTHQMAGSTISKTNSTRLTSFSSNTTKIDHTGHSILVPSSTNGSYAKVSSSSNVTNPFHPRPRPFTYCFPHCRKRLF